MAEPRTQRNLSSFTLIELLVAIAIIAILAALLLPALRNAKERSRRAICMGNLKQVAVAVQLYADDNNGWINHTGLPVAYNTWFYWITNEVPKAYDMVYRGCPDSKDYGWWSASINMWFVGGGWWPDASQPTYPQCHTLYEVKNTAQVFLVSCCYSPYGGAAYWDISVDGPYGTRPRHMGEGLNFIFVDGHGEWMKNRDWYKYPPAYEWCSATYLASILCSSLYGN